MPLKSGKSQATISKNIEIEKNAHPNMSNAQAAAIAYSQSRKTGRDDDKGETFRIYDENGKETARKHDLNGWAEIKGNPISKVGVFPYTGAQIGNSELEPDKLYNVYRPEEELSNPETIESFKLLPWTDEHAMLGSEDEGMLPAEKKGVHGVIGEDVYFENGYLKGNIKIFSNKLAQLIEDGKKELSIGYRCLYDMVSGVYNGVKYDAIQRSIRGNHLALVDEGRSGHDVAVLDAFTFCLDTKELVTMSDMYKEEKKAEDEPMSLEKVVEMVKDLAEKVQSMSAKDAEKMEGGKAPGEVKGELSEKAAHEGDEEPKEFVKRSDIEDESEEEEKKEMSEDGDYSKKDGDMSKDKKEGMDTKALLREISQRDALAAKLSHHIGVFDHAEKTLTEVAKYGVKKLGLSCKPGHEQSILAGYLAGAKPNVISASAMDRKPASSQIDAYLKGSK